MKIPKEWPTYLIQLLAVVGLLIAYYLWLYHEQLVPSSCEAGAFFDCSRVSGPTSPYATIGDTSIATLGLVGYALIFLLVWLRPFVPLLQRWGALLMICLSGGGFGFTLYLKGLELFVIGALCEYCLYSAVIMTLIFILAIVQFVISRGETYT